MRTLGYNQIGEPLQNFYALPKFQPVDGYVFLANNF